MFTGYKDTRDLYRYCSQVNIKKKKKPFYEVLDYIRWHQGMDWKGWCRSEIIWSIGEKNVNTWIRLFLGFKNTTHAVLWCACLHIFPSFQRKWVYLYLVSYKLVSEAVFTKCLLKNLRMHRSFVWNKWNAHVCVCMWIKLQSLGFM